MESIVLHDGNDHADHLRRSAVDAPDLPLADECVAPKMNKCAGRATPLMPLLRRSTPLVHQSWTIAWTGRPGDGE